MSSTNLKPSEDLRPEFILISVSSFIAKKKPAIAGLFHERGLRADASSGAGASSVLVSPLNTIGINRRPYRNYTGPGSRRPRQRHYPTYERRRRQVRCSSHGVRRRQISVG